MTPDEYKMAERAALSLWLELWGVASTRGSKAEKDAWREYQRLCISRMEAQGKDVRGRLTDYPFREELKRETA